MQKRVGKWSLSERGQWRVTEGGGRRRGEKDVRVQRRANKGEVAKKIETKRKGQGGQGRRLKAKKWKCGKKDVGRLKGRRRAK
eukprot:1404546-Pleurochrysis_carterae.AAC.1